MTINPTAVLDRPRAPLPRPVRVLVVEDSDSIRRAVALGLRASGFIVTAVRGGHDALAVHAAVTPDVIVTDLTMPDMDGITLIRTLRARGVQTPVLVMTARDGAADRLAAACAGADGFLVKPFGLTRLCGEVTALAGAAHDRGTLTG